MTRFFPYSVTPEAVASLFRVFRSRVRVGAGGIPILPGETAAAIAKAALRQNAGAVLVAGTGHFRYMWISDFGKAFRGAERALTPEYLRGQIALMIRESSRLGRVPSCFSPRRGFDMPWYRADGLPWLVFSVSEYLRWTGDRGLVDESRPALQGLLAEYERTHFKNGLIAPEFTGDWMDSVLRPSSTYNNVCALKMLQLSAELGLETQASPAAFEAELMRRRWRGSYLADYEGTDDESVDAAVYGLYLGLFSPEVRRALIERIQASGLTRPYPMMSSPRPYPRGLMPLFTRLSPGYHSTIWLHLGYMYLNALKGEGREIAEERSRLEALILGHRNIVETLDPNGRLYGTFFHATEHGLTMAAGQFLELAS